MIVISPTVACLAPAPTVAPLPGDAGVVPSPSHFLLPSREQFRKLELIFYIFHNIKVEKTYIDTVSVTGRLAVIAQIQFTLLLILDPIKIVPRPRT